MQKKYIVAGSGTLLLMLTLLFVTLARSNAYANPFTQNVWLAQNIGETRETLGFDTATNAPRFILPKGLRSADGSAYWSAFRASGATALHSFDVTKGSIRASFALEGDWELGAVSATGKWLALKRIATETERAAYTKNNAWKTTVALVDAATRKTTRTLSLNGNFDVDALNTAGSKLYLIEHLPASKPDHYHVRLFDVALGQLNEGVLVDKRNIDEVMSGYPTHNVASPNGQWLFTLYVGMREDRAFIHALNLQEGGSWCIDLPSGDDVRGDKAMLEQYSLALAPNGHTIYAVNAALGTIAMADVSNIGEPRVVSFTPFAKKSDAPMRASVVAPDAKHVYFSSGDMLWQYDVAAERAQEFKRNTLPIFALAFNADATELLLANADHSVNALPLTSSNAQLGLQSRNP